MGSKCCHTSFIEADLRSAKIVPTDLVESDCEGAEFGATDLTGGEFANTNFSNAKFGNFIFDLDAPDYYIISDKKTSLESADFSGCIFNRVRSCAVLQVGDYLQAVEPVLFEGREINENQKKCQADNKRNGNC